MGTGSVVTREQRRESKDKSYSGEALGQEGESRCICDLGSQDSRRGHGEKNSPEVDLEPGLTHFCKACWVGSSQDWSCPSLLALGSWKLSALNTVPLSMVYNSTVKQALGGRRHLTVIHLLTTSIFSATSCLRATVEREQEFRVSWLTWFSFVFWHLPGPASQCLLNGPCQIPKGWSLLFSISRMVPPSLFT